MKKKRLLYLFALICSMSLFTACNDDDNTPKPATDIAGVYGGNLVVSITVGDNTTEVEPIAQKVYISALDDEHVKLELKNFEFGPVNVGDIIINKVPVSEGKGGVVMAKTTATINHPVLKTLEIELTSGVVFAGAMDLKISVNVVDLNQKVSVAFAGAKIPDGVYNLYSFESWVTLGAEEGGVAYTVPAGGEWATADAALSLIQMMIPGSITTGSVVATDGGKSGKAAKVVTLDTQGQASIMPGFFPSIPKVTSGSLFLGSFEIDATNTLRSTRFGIPFKEKPVAVRGAFKYTPGKTYYRCDDVTKSEEAVVDASKTDECAISAVLYEVTSYDIPSESYDMSDERLNGTNIYTSDKIVAKASMIGITQSDFKNFELKLDFVKSYDPKKLYRFAIICSSSKDGDKFTGAPGSTLIVDEIEIVTE